MAETHGAEQWPSGGSLERGDDAARTQKLVEIVIGSATAIALGVGCFFLGKFLLGNQTAKPIPGAEQTVASGKAAATTDRGAAGKSSAVTPADAATQTAHPTVGEPAANPDAGGNRNGAHAASTALTPGKAATPAPAGKTAAVAPAKKDATGAGPGAEKAVGKTAPTGTAKDAGKTTAKAAATPAKGDEPGTKRTAKSAGGVRTEGVTMCKSVKDRNPESKGASFSTADGKVFCWMRVVNGQGSKVRCVWTLNGKKFEGVWLEIGSPSWRTWASKRLDSSMRGSCKVEIEAEGGGVIGSAAFEVR